MKKRLHAAQNIDSPYAGGLKISLTSSLGQIPVPGASVTISVTGQPDSVVERLTTDDSGQTPLIELPAPALEYSLEPSEVRPYSEYNISVEAPGYEPVLVEASEILPDVTSLQPIALIPQKEPGQTEDILIPEHTLYGDYPPKLPEAEIKPLEETGQIVLSRVVIPEYVVVHDGVPSDSSAPDYYVRYTDYIKNVACSEIYATWPEDTIYANILAIQSFTLNRVYTEWYRSKGYPFTITSSTAYDQKFIYGRNIYSDIERLVDSVFANYLSRPGVSQPIFTSYCDGERVSCQGLSQWGSKYLGDQGYSAIEILRYYYGDDMYINTAQGISGIPASWPGYNLEQGARGDKVRQMQEEINVIAGAYPAIPKISVDGIYGPATAAAVEKIQSVFGLPVTGITDYKTWYKISEIYVGVSRIAELT